MPSNYSIRTNDPTKVPSLSKVPASVSPELRRYLETLEQVTNIRLGRRGDPRDRAITLRELISSGLAQELAASPYNPNAGGTGFVPAGTKLLDAAVPPAPTGFSVTGAFSMINMSWNLAAYANHSHTEIHTHTSDVIGDAVLLGISPSRVFSDPVGSGQTRYYWVRHVNTEGVRGPWNAAAGTLGQTAADVNHLLNLLTGAVTSSELASSLSTPIGQIPGINTSISTINGNITTINGNITALDNFTGFSSSYSGDSLLTRMGAVETTANGAATSAQLQSEQTTRANADSALASDITTLQSSVGTNTTAIQTEQTARANADSALSTDITSLTTTVNNNAAAISAETTARSNADSALASDITSLNTATTNNAAAITAEQTARSNADSALASDITSLNTTTGNNAAAISAEATARSNADTALASDITTLNTTVSGNSTSISTQASSINGLEAKYVVKIDNNGAVAGYGLASTANSAGNILSEFIVNADRFAIMRGGSNTTAATVPFVVQASSTTLNGETVPAGVYMTDAFIKNGSIVSAKIGSLAVDKITGTFAQFQSVLTGNLDANRINIDGTTLTSTTIGGVPTLTVNAISANKVNTGTLNANNVTITNLDAADINGDINVFDAVNNSMYVNLSSANIYYQVLDQTLAAPDISHQVLANVVLQATKSQSGGTQVDMKITMTPTGGSTVTVFEGGHDHNFSNGSISQAAAGSLSSTTTTSVRVQVYAKKHGKGVVVTKIQGFIGGIR